MQIEPYLNFDGRCDEAIEFYKIALGATVRLLMRFKDNPGPPGQSPPEVLEKVMHANLNIGGATILVSDGRCQNKPNFGGIMLSLSADSDEEAERLFKALGEGGKVTMPMGQTFFATRFGMLTDRFGVNWMVVRQV